MTATVRVQQRLWRIYRRMNLAALTRDEDEDADPLGLATAEGRTHLAWETYSRGGLEHALHAYGSLERLESRGLGKLSVNLDLKDPFAPSIVVRSDLLAPPVVEASLRQLSGRQLGLGRGAADSTVLFLESLLLQNPGKTFDWHRPPLPGQEFPGLSLSGEVIQLLLLMAKRVGAEAMALRPSSFHAAWAYARHFVFVDGTAQARFEALRREPRLRPLWLLSWALELGCIRSGGERVTWTPDLMVAP
ncbi:MAG TPA: deacetylase, partial [Myxococcaceae bacterium]